jgi:hypothetical protein
MMVKLLYIICLISICSCANTKTISSTEKESFNAIVGKIGGDCGESRLLTLYKDDGKPFIQPVYEINLPDSLRVEGLKLSIEWRKPIGEEMKTCLTLGPGYDQIFIISAKRIK